MEHQCRRDRAQYADPRHHTYRERLEEVSESDTPYDPMLQHLYQGLDQSMFTHQRVAEPIRQVRDIRAYSQARARTQ